MRYLIILFSFLFSSVSHSQSTSDLSVELQLYPTGFIPGITYDKAMGSSTSLTLRLGANLFDHKDLGEHAGEEGSGIGGSLGMKKYLGDSRAKWYWGIRTDLWFNDVDWFDIGPADQRMEGQTSIIVLQPTAALGYAFLLSKNMVISPSLSFGYEWNIKTEGEPTGQGSIILFGVQIGKRF